MKTIATIVLALAMVACAGTDFTWDNARQISMAAPID